MTYIKLAFTLFQILVFGETRKPLISTFSIVARDPQTGEIGVAVQSKFVAVG